VAPLPEEVNGHFGANLVRYLLSQHYQCRVTMPLLRDRLESINQHNQWINKLIKFGNSLPGWLFLATESLTRIASAMPGA
jgi:hypothetical protein